MIITSSVFEHMKDIPSKYTCQGENINPPLCISGVPLDAESLVLIVDDPDAPKKPWTHWTVWNIDPKTALIPENSIPENSIQGITDSGKPGYGGPCPPAGTHRYFFRIFALNSKLNLSSDTPKDKLISIISNQIIDKAELVGLYAKS